VIRRWRNQWADKPRTADYGIQVLSRVLSYAVDPLGKIAGNPCEGIKQLYSENRSEIIWTESDLVQLKRACTAEIAHAVDLAAHTGLRLGDLLRLSWSHVRADTINDLDRQEQPSPGGDNPALRRAEKRPRKHSEAVDYSPHQQQASALDSERLWQLFRQSEDRGWVRGS
jgi:integrase